MVGLVCLANLWTVYKSVFQQKIHFSFFLTNSFPATLVAQPMWQFPQINC